MPPPPSPDWSTCSERAIEQCHKGCFAVSALLLISKLDFLYSRLNPSSRQYVDSIRTCPNPKLTSEMCARIPAAIVKAYTELTGSGIDIEKRGGSSINLIRAILSANSVPLIARSMIHGIPTSALPPIVNNGALMIVFTFPRLAKSIHTVKQKILTLAHKDGRIRGGLLSLEQQSNPPPGTPHAYHAVAFTICKGKLVICNYGECQSVNSKAKYAIKQDQDYAVRSVTVLVDTTKPKSSKSKSSKPKPKSSKPKPTSKSSKPKPKSSKSKSSKPKPKSSKPKPTSKSSKPKPKSSKSKSSKPKPKPSKPKPTPKSSEPTPKSAEPTPKSSKPKPKSSRLSSSPKEHTSDASYSARRAAALKANRLSFRSDGVTYHRACTQTTRFVKREDGKKTSSKGVCYQKARQQALDGGRLSFSYDGATYARPTKSSTTFVAT